MCNLLDLGNRKYTIEEVDLFSQSGQKTFKSLNPSQSMPMIKIKDQILMADPVSLIKYLCKFYSMDGLYPDGDESDKIDQVLEVVFLQFRTTTERLTKLKLMKRALALNRVDVGAQEELSEDEIDRQYNIELMVLTQAIIPQIEKWISANEAGVVLGQDVTVADLVVYQEVKQLLAVTEHEPSKDDLPSFHDWL